MNDDFERALVDSGAPFCIECGKCTAACPMAEMYPGFSWDLSPRGIIQQALRGKEILSGRAVWCCTQCRACSQTCPAGVDCCALVDRLRSLAVLATGKSEVDRCADCGGDLPPRPVLDYLRTALPGEGLNYLRLCPGCRRRAYAENNS